ncbi:LysR family transcriptional regulator [Clostridium tertium]
MDIRELEYFKMVAEMGNFTRAANKLCISQPSITVAIKKLEEELGVILFDRNKNLVMLTNEGEIFLKRVDKILMDLNNAVLEMNEFNTINKEVINLGIPPMIGASLLPKLIKKYKRNNKNVELIIHEFGSVDIIDLLEKDELDIGLIILNNSSDLLETQKIATGEIVVCLPKYHPLKDLEAIPFKILKNETFIMIEGGNNIRKKVLEECEKNKFKPKNIYSFKLFENIKNLVSNGIGISFFLDSTVSNNEKIIFRSLEEPLYIDIAIAWKKDKFLIKYQRELIDFMKSNYFEEMDINKIKN